MYVSRQKYRLDDYLQDKAARSSSPLSTKASPITRKETYSSSGRARSAPVVNAQSEVIIRPPHTVPKPTSGTVYVEKPDTGGSAGGGVLTQSQMTTAYTKQLMENALSNLLAMQNRKFKYDAHSSPLYSIVQKQAEENARLASGRAYAQAKGATGGYGSSYATLAADEAGRQAMRELDDQQLALYEAARAEFEAENASALDWYNTTRQLYEDAYLLEQDEKAKAEEAAKKQAIADGAITETASAAAQELQNAWGIDYSEKTQREYLASKGYSEADINAALESQRKLASGSVTDYKVGDVVSAIEHARTLDEAYRNGVLTEQEYNAEKTQNSEVIKNGILKEIKNESTAADALATAESAVVSGAISMSDYQDILVTNAKAELKDIDEGKGTDLKKAKKVLAIINAVLADVDSGVMNQDEADAVIREISMTEAARSAWERIQLIGYWSDEHIRRLDEEEEEAYRALAKEMEIREKAAKKVAKKAGEQDQMETIKKRFER